MTWGTARIATSDRRTGLGGSGFALGGETVEVEGAESGRVVLFEVFVEDAEGSESGEFFFPIPQPVVEGAVVGEETKPPEEGIGVDGEDNGGRGGVPAARCFRFGGETGTRHARWRPTP